MTDDPTSWRDLAARAATLGERAGDNFRVGSDDLATAAKRLDRWRTVAARRDAARFAAVLAAHGLPDEAAALALLAGPVTLLPGAPLPGWVRVARRLVRRSPVRLARATLRRRVGATVHAGLSRRAHAALEARLAARLDEAAAGPREVEQRVRRALGEPPAAEREIPLAVLFPHYPGLARVAAGLVSDWLTAQAEFLRRLHRDREQLAATFFPGVTDPGPVSSLEAGAGDAHRGGRTVLLLRFAGRDGQRPRRLVYKPRDVHPERVWANAVDRVNAAGFRPSLRAARALPRGRGAGAYGWMEWVAAAPRRGRAARGRHGRRAGALTCLFHVLGGTDGHAENVVAAGDHPVLVDVETLAHPDPPIAPGQTAALTAFLRSVLRTFLVPVPAAFRPAAADPEPPALWVPPAGFERRTRDTGGPPPDRPRLDVPRHEFMAGFRAMARWLVTPPGRRLRARAGRELSGRTVRRVWLPTAFYDELRRRSITAGCLRDGADREVELGWLRRMDAPARTESDVRTESRALAGLDIPYFTAPAEFPGDAPWLMADDPSLTRHLDEQADLLAGVLAGAGR